MSLRRQLAVLAGLSGVLGALGGVPPEARGSGAGQIWAECISGSVTDNCHQASWYTAPVIVVWHASPVPEATSPCLLGIEYPFEHDAVTGLSCTAWWREAGSNSTSLTLHVEVSTPNIQAIPERPPDANGWYNHPVAVTFKGQGYSGAASCHAGGPTPGAVYSGPDTLSASITGTCVDPAGKSASASLGLRYDATPPTITGAFPSRPPDYKGWYNHPVTFAFTGSDALSGMEACTATYSGPDSSHAHLVASCRDRAGNVALPSVSLRYEATPPPLNVRASGGDGVVSLRWQSGASVEITRSPGRHGPHASMLYSGSSGSFNDRHCRNGVKYTYTVKTKDRAGGVTKRAVSVTPGPHLRAPAANATVTTPPLLRWTPITGATYYNVQLFRGQKLFSSWPLHSTLQLSRSWRFAGSEHRLVPGKYSWYVWPGFGRIGEARYGRLIGHRTFIVR